MNDVTVSAEIHFHEQEKASIFLEANCSGDDQLFGELNLFAMFALRMMSNLGLDPLTDQLAAMLVELSSVIEELANLQRTHGVELVPYPGHPGRKQFVATLNTGPKGIRFDLQCAGFDAVATGMGYYGPTAVYGLLRHLALKRPQYKGHLASLATVAALAGQAQLARRIELTNQNELGAEIIRKAYGPPQFVMNSRLSPVFVDLLNKTREFVAQVAIRTFDDRRWNRAILTFVDATGDVLLHVYEKGGLHLKARFAWPDLTRLIGCLNILYMAAFFVDQMNAGDMLSNIRGLGIAYHLTDQEIAEWEGFVGKWHAERKADIFAFFDRVIEPTAHIWGSGFHECAVNWMQLLSDIRTAYGAMIKDPKWTAQLDAALDGASA